MENYLKTVLESMTKDELVHRILEISSCAENLSKEVIEAKELVKSLEEELARVDKKHYADVQKLRERLEAKNGLIGTLKSQLDSAKNTIEALKSRNNDNNEITTDLELDNRRLQVRIQELEKQLKLATEFGDACLDKVRDLEMKNGKLNENAKNYERKIDLQNESIHKHEERIVDLEKDLDDFKHAYEHARAELYRRDEEIADLNDQFECLKEMKLGVINSFSIDCEGEYLEIMLTHDAGKSFMRNVKVFKEGTAIKVSDFVETEKPVTPEDLRMAGETVNDFVAKRREIFGKGLINYLQKPYKTDYECMAEHIWNKYMALRKAGFDDDQAMCLIPMWDDEVDE